MDSSVQKVHTENLASEKIRRLLNLPSDFTGNVLIHFHKGQASKDVDVTEKKRIA